MVGTSLTLLCPPYEATKLVNAVTMMTQRLLDREKIFSALLQLKDASFIDPLLRFGHGFGLVVIPTGAGRFCGFVFRQVKTR
jgi:hypothetical protein